MNSTVSSLSWGINIVASRSKVIYPLERALKFAVDHLTHTSRNSVPVVLLFSERKGIQCYYIGHKDGTRLETFATASFVLQIFSTYFLPVL